MVLIKSLIVLSIATAASVCGAKDTAEVKRINERYDDFFRHREAQEERWEKRRGSADERKKREEQHARELEKAREDYVKSKSARPSDEALRLKWEAAQKERASEQEMLRRRYVDQQIDTEQHLKKGRQIPEMKEFDLEEE